MSLRFRLFPNSPVPLLHSHDIIFLLIFSRNIRSQLAILNVKYHIWNPRGRGQPLTYSCVHWIRGCMPTTMVIEAPLVETRFATSYAFLHIDEVRGTRRSTSRYSRPYDLELPPFGPRSGSRRGRHFYFLCVFPSDLLGYLVIFVNV